jgi:hypothetical protein
VFLATFNGASSTLRVDGSVVLSGNNPGTSGFDGLRISGFTGAIALLNGSIGEIACYQGVLPASSLTALERYSGRKWGISVP